MFTYAVMDLGVNKRQYYGSSTGTSRPYEHLKNSGNINLKRAVKSRPNFFYVVVSEDDGLDDRSEEQYLLDFYFGSQWCYNLSPTASGNPTAIIEYNKRVQQGEVPHSWEGKSDINTWMSKENQTRLNNGTHNFLKENVKPETEELRISKVRESMSGDKNPMKKPEVKNKISLSLKGRKWWVNEEGEIKMRVYSPGPEWQRGRKWKREDR